MISYRNTTTRPVNGGPAKRPSAVELVAIGAPFVLALLLWELLARGVLPDLAPSRILAAMWAYYPNPEFLRSLAISLKRIAIGYALAMLFGIGVGTLMGSKKPLNDVVDPFWSLLRPIAPLAWVPLAIVWFGVNEKAAVFVIAFTVFFPIMMNTTQGVRDAAAIYREAALTLGAKGWAFFWEVTLPAALPSIMAGLRVGMGLSWAVIVAAELVIGFVLNAGLGYLILRYTQLVYNLPRVVAVIVAIGVIGLLSDQALLRLGDRVTPWRPRSHQSLRGQP